MCSLLDEILADGEAFRKTQLPEKPKIKAAFVLIHHYIPEWKASSTNQFPFNLFCGKKWIKELLEMDLIVEQSWGISAETFVSLTWKGRELKKTLEAIQ